MVYFFPPFHLVPSPLRSLIHKTKVKSVVLTMMTMMITGKNNRFPFLDILGNLKNTHKNPKFGRMRQVPIRELGWEFPGWDLSHYAKFGIFMGIL